MTEVSCSYLSEAAPTETITQFIVAANEKTGGSLDMTICQMICAKLGRGLKVQQDATGEKKIFTASFKAHLRHRDRPNSA